MTHHWTKPMSFKKKVFCNVCRKRINSQGVLCEGRFIMTGEIVRFCLFFFSFLHCATGTSSFIPPPSFSSNLSSSSILLPFSLPPHLALFSPSLLPFFPVSSPPPFPVCKYYAHLKCQDNAFDDCKHCATYHSGASVSLKMP